MKVKCEECGETYILDDGETPEDYTCECGGKLEKETDLRRTALGVGVFSIPYALIGFSELTLSGIALAVILWFNGKDTSFDDAPFMIKVIAVIAWIFSLGTALILILSSLLWHVPSTMTLPFFLVLYILDRILL